MTARESIPLPPLVVVSGTSLHAFERRTGAMVWQATTSSAVRRMLLTDDRVIVLTSLGSVECFDLATGALFGSVATRVGQGEALLYDQGTILVVGTTGVAAIDLAGRVLWSQPLPVNHEYGLRGAGIPGQIVQPDYDTR